MLPAGIVASNCRRVRIVDNDIGDVGNPEALARVRNRRLAACASTSTTTPCAASTTRARSRRSTRPGGESWSSERSRSRPAQRRHPASSTSRASSLAAFAIADADRSSSSTPPAAAPSSFRADARRSPIQGNRVEAVGAANAVEVQTRGSCSFSDNRCFSSRAGRRSSEAFAGALVASDNYLEGSTTVPAADLHASRAAPALPSPATSGAARSSSTAARCRHPGTSSTCRRKETRCALPPREPASRSRSSRPASTSSRASHPRRRCAPRARRSATPTRFSASCRRCPRARSSSYRSSSTRADGRSTDVLEAATGTLVVERLRDAAAQAIELLASELEAELADAAARSTCSARRRRDVSPARTTRRRRLRDQTDEAIKERMAAAKRLGEYRERWPRRSSRTSTSCSRPCARQAPSAGPSSPAGR